MWRKSRQSILGKENFIGNPILINTTYDGDSLDALPYVNEVPSPHSPREPSSSPKPKSPQVFAAMFEMDKKSKRVSDAPTASSIYTRQSTVYDDDVVRDNSVPPLFSDYTQDKEFTVVQPASAKSAQQKRLSAIPVRKEVPPGGSKGQNQPKSFALRAQQAGVTALRPPWRGASGRSAQLTPITDRTSFLSRSTPTEEASSKPHSLSDPVSPLDDADEADSFNWSRKDGEPNAKSSSPRISVPSDDGSKALDPQPSTRSPVTPSKPEIPYPTPQSTIVQDGKLNPGGGPQTPGLSPSKLVSMPVDGGANQHSLRQAPSDSLEAASATASTPTIYHSSVPHVARNTDEQPPVSRFSWTTRATESEIPSTPETRPSLESWSDSSPPQVTPGQEPRSRFSWTTRNTESPPQTRTYEPHGRFTWTTRHIESPDMPRRQQEHNRIDQYSFNTHTRYQNTIQDQEHYSPQTQVGEVPYGGYTMPSAAPPSLIVARSRPTPPETPRTVDQRRLSAVKRKPTPSMLGTPQSDKDKDLPLSPPELESVDLITSLEAQLEDLRHRKINLEKVIENLTALQPQNPVVQDLTARRETSRKVEAFKQDLAEVKSKEHETGLRLHRAWKRRDQEQPTTLWVRRVAGPK